MLHDSIPGDGEAVAEGAAVGEVVVVGTAVAAGVSVMVGVAEAEGAGLDVASAKAVEPQAVKVIVRKSRTPAFQPWNLSLLPSNAIHPLENNGHRVRNGFECPPGAFQVNEKGS